MKKVLILIFFVLIIIVSTNVFSKEEETSTKTPSQTEQNSITYRVEENNNLITEDSSDYKTNTPVTDEEITTYIATIDSEVETIAAKENITKKEEKTLTNTFITLTDFIFYGGEIKGRTFSSLTDEAKQKIISLYEKIDAKIDNAFPGYKEKIKTTSTKTYNNVKDKVINLKDSIVNKYKDEIGEDNYNDQVETFNENKETMKESFTPVIDKIVDGSKELYETTKNKLDSWYQSWKEENS